MFALASNGNARCIDCNVNAAGVVRSGGWWLKNCRASGADLSWPLIFSLTPICGTVYTCYDEKQVMERKMNAINEIQITAKYTNLRLVADDS